MLWEPLLSLLTVNSYLIIVLVRRSGLDFSAIIAELRSVGFKNALAYCTKMQHQLATSCCLPPACDEMLANERASKQALALLRRTQPAMLHRWTPVEIEGDGNCMFRVVSLAVFGTQNHHLQLRLRTCLEVGQHHPVYDKDDSACHELLRRYTLIPPTISDLWADLCTSGCSRCYVTLLGLSAVLQRRIYSFFPPLQSMFVSPLTLEIAGRGVRLDARSLAVMWSTTAEVPTSGDVHINHIVMLQCHAATGCANHHDPVTVESDMSDAAVQSGDDVTNDKSSDDDSGNAEADGDKSDAQTAANNSRSANSICHTPHGNRSRRRRRTHYSTTSWHSSPAGNRPGP